MPLLTLEKIVVVVDEVTVMIPKVSPEGSLQKGALGKLTTTFTVRLSPGSGSSLRRYGPRVRYHRSRLHVCECVQR
jgi:hypothetical protein